MRCTECDERIGFKDKFCGNCGAKSPTRKDSSTVAEAKEYARDVIGEGKMVAQDVAKAAKAGMKTDIGKSVAACAAIGAVVAVPIPFVGPVMGAAVGAGIGFFRKIV